MDLQIRAGILVLSDKASRGERADESGRIAAETLEALGFSVSRREIIPDDLEQIVETLLRWVDKEGLDLIVTSGGTGLSPRDLTPQAMERVIDYQVPGMAEAMRAASLKKTPHAMISRAMAGVRKSSLIINLPGSPRGVKENLSVLVPALRHALSKLLGDTSDCAT
ncbi:MAG: MogA/MoaB family molybdenum cofactor biosynthesis protein [Deltaproteobacteria bacterium]|nr:MogA/MoaB family molybdenum cofactor biosynthesis protein [Deltaproteobacteria bacterium]MBW2136869.1 MogA/MoaB family molybdenum cofactor biosynthesis protein [Deltaproteobacteria bacterium]